MADTDIAVHEPVEVVEHDKVGRPCKYETHIEPRLLEIFEWLKQGYTDYSIADNLGVHQVTYIRYKQDNINLANLYTQACLERNRLVMNKMFKKATTEIVPLRKQKVTKDGEVIDIIEEVYAGPDVNAADLYLRNNDPDYKSAKSDASNTFTVNNIQLPNLQEQLQQIQAERDKLSKLLAVDAQVIEG